MRAMLGSLAKVRGMQLPRLSLPRKREIERDAPNVDEQVQGWQRGQEDSV